MNIITTIMMIITGVNAFIHPNTQNRGIRMYNMAVEKQQYLGSRVEIFNIIEPMSINIAQSFKLENENNCKYISTTELDIYVNIGLMKAVQQLTLPSVFSTSLPQISVFASYCIYNELNKGIRLVQEIQSQAYINEWEIKQQSIQETTITQHNYIQETSGELKNENDIISLFTYLELWEYINKLSPILKRAFMRKYSEYEFHPKHLHEGCVIVKSS